MQTQNQEQPQVIYHDESLADHMSGNCHAWRFTALRNCAYPVGNRTVYCTLYIIDRADAAGNRASLAGHRRTLRSVLIPEQSGHYACSTACINRRSRYLNC